MTSSKWHDFWFPKIDPFGIGLFRVVLSVYLLIYYTAAAPNWLTYYGPDSIPTVPQGWPEPFNPAFFSALWYVHSETLLWCWYALSLICVFLLMAGEGKKWPVLWLWISNYCIFHRNVAVSDGEEQVLSLLLFGALFLPLDAACCLRKGSNSDRPVTVWALRYLQIHIALIYLISWPFKLISDPAWRDGTVIYYASMSLTWVRWPYLGAFFEWQHAIFSRVATFYTLGIELLFPLLVWFRRFRLPMTLAMMALHISLAAVLGGLMMFNLSMLTAMVLFLPSHRMRLFYENK
jgi:hypothetical protein